MADIELLDSVGLGPASMMKTQGKVCGQKFPEILAIMADDNVSSETKQQLTSQFKTWVCIVPSSLREKQCGAHLTELFGLIETLCAAPDDSPEGKQCWANNLANGLGTCVSMDTTGKCAKAWCKDAFLTLEKILNSNQEFQDTGVFVQECAATHRCDVCKSLARMLPYQGSVNIPNGMSVVKRILVGDDYPDSLKTQMKSTLQTMSQVNKEALKHSGGDIMELIVAGGNDNLIFTIVGEPALYLNNPGAIHKHLDFLFENMQYLQVCSLYNNIAQKHPRVLVSHASYFLAQLRESPNMASITVMILKEIAGVAPDDIFKHLDEIASAAKDAAGINAVLPGIYGKCASAKSPAGAADHCLKRLVEGLKNCSESSFIPSWLMEISNIKQLLSSRDVLVAHMKFISTLKGNAEIVVTELEDYAAGRSLETLTVRVDDMEAKINALNNKVAESCANFEDVMAYVDANIADVKDFIGDIVKKLPTPKRLEVIGTVRKTLILHFECVRTGYEYPIKSHEWNKWLKVGFNLASTGKAIIDIGMGNPFGLLKTGAEAVQGIYDAYKSSDDDEFNTYITNPFLTSDEQDGLINKLRDQGFFEVMAYDSQLGGWYLIDPEKDGSPPEGEAGSVTKMRSKKGHGITETLQAAAKEINPDMVSEIEGAVGFVSDTVEVGKSLMSSSSDGKGDYAPVQTGSSGAARTKAAAGVRAGRTTGPISDDKAAELEARLNAMEKRLNNMQQQIDNGGGGGCCVVS